MFSIRTLASRMGLPGTFQVVRDFFGYSTGAPAMISLAEQARLLWWEKYLNINVIRMGSNLFSNADEQEIDRAVLTARHLYAAVDLGIGRVQHYGVPVASANGHAWIDNDAEAEALTQEFTVPNDALDVFIVRDYATDTIGLSAVNGSCDKNDTAGMTGSVVSIEVDPWITGYLLAHEMAHYLGLEHTADKNDLMFDSCPCLGYISGFESLIMRSHCFIKPYPDQSLFP